MTDGSNARDEVPARISVRNLEVVYNDVSTALDGVSLDLPVNATVAVLGGNGAGKTTLARAITGLLPLYDAEAKRGEVLIDGHDTISMRSSEIARLGVAQVPEGRGVFSTLTVEETLRLGSVRHKAGSEDFERIFELFPRLRDRLHQRVGYMSGGEQQMVALGRALIGQPSLLILDEPSLGLAPALVEQIFVSLDRVKRSGISILLIEQNVDLALRVSDYGYVLENGLVVLDGQAQALQGHPDIREFYLGLEAEDRRSYAKVKQYRRRKRWGSW